MDPLFQIFFNDDVSSIYRYCAFSSYKSVLTHDGTCTTNTKCDDNSTCGCWSLCFTRSVENGTLLRRSEPPFRNIPRKRCEDDFCSLSHGSGETSRRESTESLGSINAEENEDVDLGDRTPHPHCAISAPSADFKHLHIAFIECLLNENETRKERKEIIRNVNDGVDTDTGDVDFTGHMVAHPPVEPRCNVRFEHLAKKGNQMCTVRSKDEDTTDKEKIKNCIVEKENSWNIESTALQTTRPFCLGAGSARWKAIQRSVRRSVPEDFLCQDVCLFKDGVQTDSAGPYRFSHSKTEHKPQAIRMVQGKERAMAKLRDKTHLLNNGSRHVDSTEPRKLSKKTGNKRLFRKTSSSFTSVPAAMSPSITHDRDKIMVFTPGVESYVAETRSIIKIKAGLFSVAYGIMLRWIHSGDGEDEMPKIAVVVLKKNAPIEFLSPPTVSRKTFDGPATTESPSTLPGFLNVASIIHKRSPTESPGFDSGPKLPVPLSTLGKCNPSFYLQCVNCFDRS